MKLDEIRKVIPDNQKDRLPKEMIEKFEGSPFVDIHTHIFTLNDVPSKFLGIRLPMTRRFMGNVTRVIRHLRGKDSRDEMSGYAYFLETMKERSSNAIYRRMNKTYYADKYPDAVFGVLTMDMDVGIDGRAHNSIWTQLSTVAMVRNLYPDKIIPFASIDPRRKDALELFKDAFDDSKPYKYYGLKVYPSLGYLPSHPTLLKMLQICSEKGIPVLTHCSSGSTHGTAKRFIANGTFVNYDYSLITDNEFKARLFKKQRDYRNFFNRPHHWRYVLDQFPNLRLNIAHFGGGQAWREFISGKDPKWVQEIIDLIEKYDHVYSDFSYTLYESDYSLAMKGMMTKIPKLKERVLFGSDYYMLVIEEDYKKILAQFENDMGPVLMDQLARTNNRNYLGL